MTTQKATQNEVEGIENTTSSMQAVVCGNSTRRSSVIKEAGCQILIADFEDSIDGSKGYSLR